MFKDRREAGRRLASSMDFLRGEGNVVVLAIPRGGVVVARPVADALNASLDIIVTRKIGAPGNPELAIGAVTQDGEAIIDGELVALLRVSDKYIEEETARQAEEVRSRMRRYRGDRPYPDLKGKVVVIVDDGIATGATIRAAIRSVRKKNVKTLIVAAPVGSRESVSELSKEADRMVCLETPEPFFAIGQFYEEFEPVEDEEVQAELDGRDGGRRNGGTKAK